MSDVDNTAEVQSEIDACPLDGTVDGAGGTYYVRSLHLKSRMALVNCNLRTVQSYLDYVSPVTIGATNDRTARDHITLQDVHIDGRRSLQVRIVSAEDGGRHGIRVLGALDNLLIDRCSANNCATDGLMFYSGMNTRPVGYTATQPLQTNITLVDSQFSGNRRHGCSADCIDGFTATGCKFNDNGKPLADNCDADGGLSGALSIGDEYGDGLTFEAGSIAASFSNITLTNCEALRNVRSGVLIYEKTDQITPGFVPHANITIVGGSFDCGTQAEIYYAIALTPSASHMPNGITFEGVSITGAAISGAVQLVCVDGGTVTGNTIVKHGGASKSASLVRC